MNMKGTIKQLAGKYRVGNTVIDQPMLSVLTRIGKECGFAVELRKISSGKRGKPNTEWDITLPFNVEPID